MGEKKGKVYLVGAGPGSIEYLSLRAYQLLGNADVLVYDALVDASLLDLVANNCLKLDVGKRGGKPSTPQNIINQILVKYCQEGKQVVRLKSGDPFIFGRSAVEINALRKEDCEFEVVPGISSALAAPLLTGIPLTDKVLSRCFAVFSGHEPNNLEWEALSKIDTLVILMGGRNIAEIVKRLQQHGRSQNTPIAIIRWAATAQQEVWMGTLETILKKVSGINLSPTVVVIGEVVGLRSFLEFETMYLRNPLKRALHSKKMAIHETEKSRSTHSQAVASKNLQLPLNGKTILVTRATGQSSEFKKLLSTSGANVIEMPALEIAPPSSWEALDNAIANLADFHWLILTSVNCVDYFFERLIARGKDIRALVNTKIAVVGEKTARSLKKRCLQPDFIPPNFIADSLIEHFPEALTDKKILFPRVESGGREVLVKGLTAQGAQVLEVAAYQSCCPQGVPPSAELALQSGAVDVITFASSKTVAFFYELAEKIFAENTEDTKSSLLSHCLEGVCIASIGPQTSKTCHSLIGRVDVEAQEHTLDGLHQALIEWVANCSQN
ncbi:uroporphyrinogen-III C-methyltransferase [Mastigocoleus sp. MO_188.B34]|uniref:uroporphyrinogen-III C-methyltransferase n=1 Tax=Mastigocoleus sp. MO_188.B34 TaxID=3036635 RepID=UPI00260A7503|nr:uroporphyrinogen-III C-methyltransferase [Mastigocoleus sp. MO_188.B34]MDJ0695152.1 uroporphyrinogen-III C-methyltransferase [Mastigocoleus sp. MO_188.B34]